MNKVHTDCVNSTNFIQGSMVRFEYDGIIREGTVNVARQDYVIIELNSDKDGRRYKSFRYEKIKPVSWTGWEYV